jgi:hemolysin III
MNFVNFREPVSAWSHCAGFILALPGTFLLWRRSCGDGLIKRLSLLVFGLSLAFCYAASTVYHGARVPTSRLAALDRLDRIGIFLLIAGTYTPLAWTLLEGWWRRATLISVWVVATVASGIMLARGPFPLLLNTGLYLGMGWGAVACYAELSRVVSPRALRLLFGGGLLYSIGAALNAIGWPILWPGRFGAHELFHLFVIAGSLTHYRLMLDVVGPFARTSRERSFEPM